MSQDREVPRSWEIENMWADMKDFSIYSRIEAFMDGVDLEGGNWHSGMVKKKNDGTLRYKKSYRDDCIRDDETADVVYLRSGDKEKAFGVITNRRANYYTLGEGDCADPLEEPLPPNRFNLRSYGSVEPDNGKERLRLRNMKFGQEYKIKYFSPYDQLNSIKEETKFGSKITLDFPEMDTLDIVLFEAFPMSGNFKSMHSDTTNSKEILTRESKKEKSDEVIVYPNPNDGSFTVLINSQDTVKQIQLTDNLGKNIKSWKSVVSENHLKVADIKAGVYFLNIFFKNKIIRKKLIIK